jgi:SpoIID/LytB domain protein
MNFKRESPELQVGIFSAEVISFTLNGLFMPESDSLRLSGNCKVFYDGGRIALVSGDREVEFSDQLVLIPVDPGSSSFTLQDVIIGLNFHWQRKEDQSFSGCLKFIAGDEKITAINLISIEEYLKSVISSEMKATASEELLKAHAVISRGWILAQMEKRRNLDSESGKYNTNFTTDSEIVRWYDREDHKNFDVCADDHCQRYQGITKAATRVVAKAVEETSGEVLTYGGNICDTRYYKCCGGVTELFENVWEPVSHPYLQRIVDNPVQPEGYDLDFNKDANIRKWILSKPEAFCNTPDKEIPGQVLNDYDLETKDFYRWKVTYTRERLSELIRNKTGIDFGMINELVPLERGTSGRIIRLKIEGTLKTMIIGKELEIRKSLSETHLYSSCFIPEKVVSGNEILFVLYGAGWGHGVGLCQIGAAVMGSKGYKYDEILMHYFKGAKLEKKY